MGVVVISWEPGISQVLHYDSLVLAHQMVSSNSTFSTGNTVNDGIKPLSEWNAFVCLTHGQHFNTVVGQPRAKTTRTRRWALHLLCLAWYTDTVPTVGLGTGGVGHW